jgi:hypothetical protein
MKQRPDYIEILKEKREAKSQRSHRSNNDSPRSLRDKLDAKLLIRHIAKEIYMHETFNLGTDPSTHANIKPSVDDFIAGNLTLLATSYKYDGSKSKKGMSEL